MSREKLYEYNGIVYTVRELSEMSGVGSSVIIARVNRGMTIQEAMVAPVRRKRHIEKVARTTPATTLGRVQKVHLFNGAYLTIQEIAKQTGLLRCDLAKSVKQNPDIRSAVDSCRKPCKVQLFEYKGQMFSVLELSKISGINHAVMKYRLQERGWAVERAVTTPVRAVKCL